MNACCCRRNRRDMHVRQKVDSPLSYPVLCSCIKIPIPKKIFYKNYPDNPTIFGEFIRKSRMDANLQIHELAEMLGVTEDTIINWELRGVNPVGENQRKVLDFINHHQRPTP